MTGQRREENICVTPRYKPVNRPNLSAYLQFICRQASEDSTD